MYISPNDKLKVTLALWPAPKTITGITRFAVLAKQFRSPMMLESLDHSLGAWRLKNLVKRLGKEISERDVSVMIHTTWHETSVRKNAYLLMKRLAEHIMCGIIFPCLWPLKLSVELKIEIFTKTIAVRTLFPGFGYVLP